MLKRRTRGTRARRPVASWRRRGCALAAATAAGLPVAALAPATAARADIVQSSEGWVLSELNVEPAWQLSTGQHVLVAVIDSGVDPNVPDLTGQVSTGPNYSGVGTPSDNPNWGVHGTWMASLIAGHGHGPGGSDGILGTAPGSHVLSIRVITDSKDPDYAKYEAESASEGQHELAHGILYAIRHHAGVISMSLGYSLPSRQVRAALQDAYEHNVVVVASAGNSGDTAGAAGTGNAPYSFPANYPGVLAVAAVNASGQVASFSSENLSVQVAAPGYKVPAEGRDGQYWYVSGTSPACALTAGVVALIKSRYPGLTDPEVISAITSSTTTRPHGGYDEQIGFGVVNADAALIAAGRISHEAGPPTGMPASAHFGGGVSAIPAPPVAPRGPGALIWYCILGVAALAVVAVATSRLLAARDAMSAGPPPGREPPARHAASRPRGGRGAGIP
jgi:subtilisin family serine protease